MRFIIANRSTASLASSETAASSTSYLSVDELNLIFKAASSIPNTLRSYRDMAVLAVMVDSKFTSQTISKLRYQNILPIILGHQKLQDPKNSDVFVSLSRNTCEIIKRWVFELDKHSIHVREQNFPLFFSLKTTSDENIRNTKNPEKFALRRDAITKIFLNAKSNSGINRLNRNLLVSSNMDFVDMNFLNKEQNVKYFN
jgi:hypothetical protein